MRDFPRIPIAISLLAWLGCTGKISGPGAGIGGPGGGPTGTQPTGTQPTGTQPTGGASASGAGGGNGGSSVVTPAGGSAGTGSPIVQLDCSKPVAPRAPMRRLTRFEYNNTVRDLFKITTRPADALPGEEAGNGFGNDADALGVSRLLVDGYRSVAHTIALQVAPDNATTISFAGCPTPLNESTCSSRLIANVGLRAYRRPLEARETTALGAVFNMGRMTGDFAAGARAVIERILQSPQFLYRIEAGEPVEGNASLMRPTPYEMASRLSFLFWGSAPDQPLLDDAAAGKLRTKADILAQAQRLIADPRAKEVARFFHGQLYGIRGLGGLVRDVNFYPTFKPGMGALMRQETEQFIDHVLWNGTGTFNELMTAPYTFVNATLATFYGISGVSGDTFTKVDVDTTRRSGLLTQASILAITTPGSRTDPVVRGKWIYNNMLCRTVPDPPMGVPPAPDPTPGTTTRQRFEEHRNNDACRGCHLMLDPIGYGFEHYDGVGLWRDLDNGLPIDDSGNIPNTDAAGDFKGAVELARKLGASRDAQNCFVGKWLTYAYGRAETALDACTRKSLQDAFAASGGDIKQLMLALTQTDAFLYGPAPTSQN
jgi:hypothetical protein